MAWCGGWHLCVCGGRVVVCVGRQARTLSSHPSSEHRPQAAYTLHTDNDNSLSCSLKPPIHLAHPSSPAPTAFFPLACMEKSQGHQAKKYVHCSFLKMLFLEREPPIFLSKLERGLRLIKSVFLSEHAKTFLSKINLSLPLTVLALTRTWPLGRRRSSTVGQKSTSLS